MQACVRGVVGLVKWSYYHAAAINGYTVTRKTDGTWALRATVVTSDAYKLAQRPLIFVAPHEHGQWAWEMRSHSLDGGVLRATLGPVEESGDVPFREARARALGPG